MTLATFRSALAAAALSLAAATAAAEPACEEALRAVHEAGAAAGPFRVVKSLTFFKDGKRTSTVHSIQDTLFPDRYYRYSRSNTGQVSHFMIVGEQGWEMKLGSAPEVMQPLGVRQLSKMLGQAGPFLLKGVTDVSCGVRAGEDGKQVKSFTWVEVDNDRTATYDLVVDLQSGLPMQLHRKQGPKTEIESTSLEVFLYDPLIRIEPPSP